MVFVLTGHVNAIQVSLDLIAHSLNVQEDALEMVIVQMEFVIVDRDGEVILVKFLFAQIIAIIMENVFQENVIAELVLLEMIVQFVPAHQIVIIMEHV